MTARFARDDVPRLALVLPDGSRVPVSASLTIGRGEHADVRIGDQTLSRVHARIMPGPDGATIEDAGSRFGTMLSGSLVDAPMPLHPGAQIQVGDVLIGVEDDAPADPGRTTGNALQRPDTGPGETIVAPVDATLMGVRAAPAPAIAVDGRPRPRLRSGWALKRLGAEEGERWFVLRDLQDGAFRRMDATDAALFELIDGKRSVAEILGQAGRLLGADGSARLARLIADLGDREMRCE